MNPTQARVFTWHELLSDHPGEAADFFASVCGWTVERVTSGNGSSYFVLKRNGQPVAGVMARPQPEVPACWDGHVAVPDLDATLAKAASLGARIVFDVPKEVPGWGRFNYLLDPQGAGLGIIQPVPEDEAGHANTGVDWNELVTPALEPALDFYQTLFGWREVERLDTPTGPYVILGYDPGHESSFGAVYQSTDERTGWRYYLHVDKLDDALEAVQAGGGEVTMGPHEVPGGSFIAICTDPWGRPFALHAPRC